MTFLLLAWNPLISISLILNIKMGARSRSRSFVCVHDSYLYFDCYSCDQTSLVRGLKEIGCNLCRINATLYQMSNRHQSGDLLSIIPVRWLIWPNTCTHTIMHAFNSTITTIKVSNRKFNNPSRRVITYHTHLFFLSFVCYHQRSIAVGYVFKYSGLLFLCYVGAFFLLHSLVFYIHL